MVQVAAVSEFPTLAAFRAAITALPLKFSVEGAPTVRFRSLRGRDLEFTYGLEPKVDGKPIGYASWPLFGGPFLQADVDSEQLEMRHGKLRRTLDFKKLTITDAAGEIAIPAANR